MDLLHTVHVPAGDGPFPAVLALHGWGASGHDLIGLAPLIHGGRALVLCPQGPVSFEVGQGMRGHGWFPLTHGGPPDPAEYAKGKAAIARFLAAALERYPIDPRKLVLLGFSQGGVMAYDLALHEPARFAGLVALSSWLPAPMLGAIPREAAHESLPVFVSHGVSDPMIAIERGRESRDGLAKLGVNLTYREYEMGHEVSRDALRDLVGWLGDKVFQPIQLA